MTVLPDLPPADDAEAASVPVPSAGALLGGLIDDVEAVGRLLGAGTAWFHQVFDAVTACPATGAVVDLAGTCRLSLAKRLATHPDADVRLALCANPMAIDADLQLLLAGDPDERVVLALLAAVDPYVETCEAIIAGPHPAARRQLARRNLLTRLLEQLAGDPHPVVAAQARLALAERAERIAAGRPAPALQVAA